MQETRYICSVICKQILFHAYNTLIKLGKFMNFFGNRCRYGNLFVMHESAMLDGA
jgi:hypothetical protein